MKRHFKTRTFGLIILVVVLLLTGCGGNSLQKSVDALQKSGVLATFFTYPGDPDLLHVDIDSSYIYEDGKCTYQLPEDKIKSPVYTVEYDDSGSGRFTSVKAEGGKLSDEDALKKGTLVVMVSRNYDSRVYEDKKGKTIRGNQEELRVYLYDIESGKIFGDEKFYGEDLKSSYEKFGGGDVFTNRVDRKEVEAWIDTYR